MKYIGFWKEYTKKNTDISIQDFIMGEKFENENDMTMVLNYLKNGKFILSDRLVTKSTVTGERFDPHTIYTDGEWIWTSGLIYYVKKFLLIPSEKFLEHIKSKKTFAKDLDIDKDRISELSNMAYKKLAH